MHRLVRCSIAVLALCAALLSAPPAAADPGSAILDVRPLGGRQLEVVVHSAAMNRPITLWMSHPGPGAPALYLLNAVDGGETGGPPLLESRFAMTGRNAVAGASMSATAALNLALDAPGRYQAVGAYSGCAHTTSPAGRALVHSQLAAFGANAANMWGAPDNPAWTAHDPFLRAGELRGLALYISAGDGRPDRHDQLGASGVGGNPATLVDRAVVGGVMESVVGGCTHRLSERLGALGIPATVAMRPGTHAWPYWQDDLHDSWPIFAAAIGA